MLVPVSFCSYINHGHKEQANTRLERPLWVNGKWRVGLYAIRRIEEGEEILYDYGQQPNPPPFMQRKKSQFTRDCRSSSSVSSASSLESVRV